MISIMGTSKAQSVIYHATVMLFIYVKGESLIHDIYSEYYLGQGYKLKMNLY